MSASSPLHSPHSPRWRNPFDFTRAPAGAPLTPAPEIRQLARTIDEQRRQTSYFAQVKGFTIQLSISAGISYMTGNPTAFAAVVANKCVNGGTFALQRIGNYTFPQINTNWKKLIGLAISARVVWIASEKAGYPLGYLFLFGVSMNAFGTISQALKGRSV